MSIVELSFLSLTHAYFSMRVQLQRLFEHWRSTWEVGFCMCLRRHGKKTDILDLFWHSSIKHVVFAKGTFFPSWFWAHAYLPWWGRSAIKLVRKRSDIKEGGKGKMGGGGRGNDTFTIHENRIGFIRGVENISKTCLKLLPIFAGVLREKFVRALVSLKS